jgi:hypothetical protein
MRSSPKRRPTDAIARGAEAEGRSRSQTKQILGTQRAGYAGQGVDVGTGSAVDVAADTTALGELDAMTIRNNAKREAYGYQVQAAGFRAQQGAAKQRGAQRLDVAAHRRREHPRHARPDAVQPGAHEDGAHGRIRWRL